MKKIIFVTCILLSLQSQIVTTTNDIFVPLQRSFDLVLSSNTFHSAKIADTFGFDVGISQQLVVFPKFKTDKFLDGEKLDLINMRTITASIDLPIYLQFGLHLTLPSYKFKEYDTNLIGFFGKVQIDQFLSEHLPNIALHYNLSEIEIGNFLTSKTISYQLQMSSKVLFLNFYAGMIFNINNTDFTFNKEATNISNERKEFYYRAGVNAEIFFLNIYVESSINNENDYKNISFGISLKI